MPAMDPQISVEIQGMKEAQAKAEQMVRDMQGTPMLQAMRDCTLKVETLAKQKLQPWSLGGGVDTGRLRASITPEVRVQGGTVRGVVGSNVVYAPYIETGTRPHWPPPGALAVWAQRHGVPEFVIRRAIAAHGTRARSYLRGALKESFDFIRNRLSRAVGGIVKK